ncbi:MAG: nucleoside hydrolase [Ruminococcus sp.]|nr:nucleoside hydrolase [Candidatus Copronaster equi]
MSNDFLCEKRLAELSPTYHTLVKNTAFAVCFLLEKYRTYFPDFTDHTVLHSLQVLDFCNRLLGDTVYSLNEDELYVLIMSAYLHDSGMGISEDDYKKLYDVVVSEEYRIQHPMENTRETIRAFHQSFSHQFIYKYAEFFEIPSEEHIRAIALVSGAHRKIDLFDENAIPSIVTVPNGNEIHLPFLASLIRLADELDIAADRNLGFEPDERETIFKMMHRSIRRLHILPDRFQLDVVQDDPALFDGIVQEVAKLRKTLLTCVDAVSERTPFCIRQTEVEINRIHMNEKHITVLDTDLSTDDVCALFMLKSLAIKPDFIVASSGNISSDGICGNAVILKKHLGLDAFVVRGTGYSNNPPVSLAEKNTFHGSDGLADYTVEMMKNLDVTQSDLTDVLTFEEFEQKITAADSVTYITGGTLKNLAVLLENEEFRRKLRGAYITGGGIKEFNCSNETELNFLKDPESVKTVLSSGLNITLFPLDLTNHLCITAEQIDELEKIGSYPEFIRFLRHNLNKNTDNNGIFAAVLRDAAPLLYLAHPEWFRLEEMRILSDDNAHIFISGQGEAVHICTEMKEDRLFEVLKSAFKTFSSSNISMESGLIPSKVSLSKKILPILDNRA